ncbi:RNA polymerase sigma factor RpoH [Minicystis rosea]|nr:RNA polymerase sigma factor RpoH [Minicystis rosea]
MTISDTTSLARYRSDIARRAPLTPELEQDLARRCQGGDQEAARRLIEGCLGAVLRVAVEYRRWGLPIEDLVQEGNVGLLKAVARFDPSHGVRLAHYAQYWIRAEIREYVARHYRIVRLGSSKGERRALRLFRKTREQRPEVLAEMSGLPTERVLELLPLLMQGDARLTPSDDGQNPLERMADRVASAEDAFREAEERARVRGAVAKAVSGLSEREQDIVRRRLLSEDPETLEQLSVTWGVSRERVRQIEERAKTRMRAQLADLVHETGYALGA